MLGLPPRANKTDMVEQLVLKKICPVSSAMLLRAAKDPVLMAMAPANSRGGALSSPPHRAPAVSFAPTEEAKDSGKDAEIQR
jgi:hypothetical protein